MKITKKFIGKKLKTTSEIEKKSHEVTEDSPVSINGLWNRQLFEPWM